MARSVVTEPLQTSLQLPRLKRWLLVAFVSLAFLLLCYAVAVLKSGDPQRAEVVGRVLSLVGTLAVAAWVWFVANPLPLTRRAKALSAIAFVLLGSLWLWNRVYGSGPFDRCVAACVERELKLGASLKWAHAACAVLCDGAR